jgi:hypothetical protein
MDEDDCLGLAARYYSELVRAQLRTLQKQTAGAKPLAHTVQSAWFRQAVRYRNHADPTVCATLPSLPQIRNHLCQMLTIDRPIFIIRRIVEGRMSSIFREDGEERAKGYGDKPHLALPWQCTIVLPVSYGRMEAIHSRV